MNRKIIHLDMDCFFAAVEMRDRPELAHRPIGIGGSRDRRGVLCTANYVARKFGVRSAMPTFQALKLCPDLLLIKPNFAKYAEASRQVFEVFYEYTDLVEPMSLDEAYLDVTDSSHLKGSATLIAQEIRARVFEKTKLTISAGIAPNKLVSKLASDHNKPNGQFTVAPANLLNFMRDTPLARLNGVGPATSKRLKDIGLVTCEDVWRLERWELQQMLGKFGDQLFDFSRGQDEREVQTHHIRKSLSVENTYAEDLTTMEQMEEALAPMFDEVMQDLTHYQDRQIKALHVKIKYHDFKQTTIERANVPLEFSTVQELFRARFLQDPRPVRLLGVGVRFDDPEEDDDDVEEDLQLSFDSLKMIG